MQKVKILAYRLGENIRLRELKNAYTGTILSSSPVEVFINLEDHAYIYVQNYGEVAFSDCSETTVTEFLAFAKRFVDRPILYDKEYKEDFHIAVDSTSPLCFEYNSMTVAVISADVIKIAMLNVSQSVVLDYFTDLAQSNLFETTGFTNELERKGRLGISKNKLMRLIGKSLNIRNRITDNLYFLDAPDSVWEDEYLSQINTGLSGTFHLKTRFKEVEYTLKIIDNNQAVFAQVVQHRDANKLEWVIILLIFFEVLNALIGKFL